MDPFEHTPAAPIRSTLRQIRVGSGCILLTFGLGSCSDRQPLRLNVQYPRPDSGAPGDSDYVLGAVSDARARVVIDGHTVPVFRNGGFVAYVPTPATLARHEILATRGQETTKVILPLRHVRPSIASNAQNADHDGRDLGDDTDVWYLREGIAGNAVGSVPALANVQTLSTDTAFEIMLPIREPRPVRVRSTKDTFAAFIPGLQLQRSATLTTSDPFINSITLQRIGTGLELKLRTRGPVFGYSVTRSEGQITIRLRRPPPIDSLHPLRALRLAVDAGHPPGGAVGPTGLKESDATLAVAGILEDMLSRRGAEVISTRRDSNAVSLIARREIVARSEPHALVSLHFDAVPPGRNPFTVRGISTYALTGPSSPLAVAVQWGMMRRMGQPDRGAWRRDLAMLRDSWVPSILAEGSVITLPEQEDNIRTPAFRRQFAQGVVDGLEMYFRVLESEITNAPLAIPLAAIAAALKQYPEPVSVSPDGAVMLFRALGDTTHELRFVKRADGKTVATLSSDSRPAGPAWSRDSKRLSYFLDGRGDQRYRLMIYDLARAKTTQLETPATRSPVAAWAPDGGDLAYVVDGFGSRERSLMVAATRNGASRVVAQGVAEHSGMAWSPDGRTIAFSARGDEGGLRLLSLDGRQRRIEVLDYGEIRDIVWPETCECVFVTARRAGTEFFRLFRVTTGTNVATEIAAADGDIVELRQIGSDIGYHVMHDGEVTPRLVRWSDAISSPRGSTRVVGYDGSKGSLVVTHTGFSSTPRFMTLPSGQPSPSDSVGPEHLKVRGESGVMISGFLWRTSVQTARPQLLVLVHGGPALQSLPTWDPGTQYALEHGVSVLAVNYRGSTGYGASFEGMGADIDGQVQDLISSIELGRRRLGVSSDRVIVWGHSHGALLVERALRQMPLFSGKAILVSYIGDPIFRDRPMQSRARVIAFHGAHDVVRSPASALGELQRIFGERLIDFEALVDEGHSFRRALSWARVYRSALSD